MCHENRAEGRPHCYLYGGLGFTTLRTFNRYKRGEIKKHQCIASSGTPARLARGDWITVGFIGGPHNGARLAWPVDEPRRLVRNSRYPLKPICTAEGDHAKTLCFTSAPPT